MRGSLAVKRGFWYVVLYFEDNGETKSKWINTNLRERGNKKAAQKILDDKLSELSAIKGPETLKKRLIPKSPDEPKEIFWVDWLNDYLESSKDKLSPNAYASYKSYLNITVQYFRKTKIRLKKLSSDDIMKYFDYLRKERNIKEITIKHYANLMRPALRKAFKERIIKENPFDFMPTIKKEKFQHAFYDQKEMENLFKILKGHKLEFPFRMLAYYGLRRSELVGLKWQAIDFTNKTIQINHKVLVENKVVYLLDNMKTQTSLRTLPLIPQMEKELLLQKDKIEKNMIFFGKDYNLKYKDYVFVNELGNLLLPDYLSHQFTRLLKENNLKHIRLHDLRHSCASIMLANGVQMKQIQEWLGHSNFSTTADVYSHLDFSSKIQSAAKISAALKSKVKNYPDEITNILSVVPEQFLKEEKERQVEEQIDEELNNLKTKMKSLGATKLSELFSALDSTNKSE